MTDSEKRIVIVTQDVGTMKVYVDQLRGFIGEDYVRGIALDMGIPRAFCFGENDLIVVSCESVKNEILRHALLENQPIITATTSLDIANLSELVQLPRGMKALVVTCFEETAVETIDLLHHYGFEHLDLIPHYPGVRTTVHNTKIAITTGVGYLAPVYTDKIIDIGVRKLDISTVVVLLLAMGIPLDKANLVSEQYLREIIMLSSHFLNMATQFAEVSSRMQTLLNMSHEGVIAIDENEVVTFINTAAIRILDLKSTEVVGQKLSICIPGFDFDKVMETKNPELDTLRTIKGKSMLISMCPIFVEEDLKGAVALFRSANDVRRLEREIRSQTMQTGHKARYCFNDIIGTSDVIKRTIATAKNLASTDFTVLIEGESGTGKELFAQAIHNFSPRRHQSFVPANFAAIPESLAESELFGYNEGAFTGARRGGSVGLFELANRGTLFLDEIGDASLEIQARLLRVLEDKRIRRVGGSNLVPVDVRIVAATNRNLESMVENGTFRYDLYYRLHVLPLTLPPLRSRREDIVCLIDFFSREFTGLPGRLKMEIINYMKEHCEWTGNVRQLENAVKYLTILSRDKQIGIADVQDFLYGLNVYKPHYLDQHVKPKNCENYSLSKEGQEEGYRLILKELAEAQDKGICIGRKAICGRLAENHRRFSEHTVRRLLEQLKREGYVVAGETRQGSRLTRKGYSLWRELSGNQNGFGG